MRPILLDTNAYTAFMRGVPEVVEVVARAGKIGLTGQPIPTNDLWIAASTLQHGAALLTRDAHFVHIDGMRCGWRLGDLLP